MQANKYPGRMYGFPYGMGGMSAERPGKYNAYSPMENIDKISTSMLLVAGGQDSKVPAVHAQRFKQRLDEAGKRADLLYFENEGHLIEKSENKELFWNRIISYLVTNF